MMTTQKSTPKKQKIRRGVRFRLLVFLIFIILVLHKKFSDHRRTPDEVFVTHQILVHRHFLSETSAIRQTDFLSFVHISSVARLIPSNLAASFRVYSFSILHASTSGEYPVRLNSVCSEVLFLTDHLVGMPHTYITIGAELFVSRP